MLKIGDLRLSIPVIQGGMGVGISLSGLAAAVANEGGIGVISAAGLGMFHKNAAENYVQKCISRLRLEIAKAREKSAGLIGVNVMVALTNYCDLARTAIEEKIDILFSGAGLPLDLPSFLKEGSTTKLVPIISSGRAAKLICEKWKSIYNYLPDALVLEGPMAGGHLGYKYDQIDDPAYTLENLLPEVLEVAKYFEQKYDCKMPVIAGGGIYTGEDMARIMALGASAVQLGSLFVTTDECDADLAFKETYINATKEDIVLIKSPVGMPGRAIKNKFIEKIELGECVPKGCSVHCIKTCKYPETPYCIMLSLCNAYKGNLNKGYAFAGSNAYKATQIKPVKVVIDILMKEYNQAVAKAKGAEVIC